MQTLSKPGWENIFIRKAASIKSRLLTKQAIYVQCNGILRTNSSTTMRGRSKPERVDVRLDLLQICGFTITKRKYYIWKN